MIFTALLKLLSLFIDLSNVYRFLKRCIFLIQVKYFDSGDYAMAKSEKKVGPAAAAIGNRGKLPVGVGKAIPTPDNIPHRKTSVPSKLVEGQEQPPVAVTR